MSSDRRAPDEGAGAGDTLHLALVLNGGVSLAVWMSGAVLELDRARCAQGRVAEAVEAPEGGSPPAALDRIVGALFDAAQQRVVIDLVAGTSAGGINGALLAAAIANGRRLDRETLLETWLTNGDMSLLLRSTQAGADTPSLLKGDEVLSTGLEEAIAKVMVDGSHDPRRPARVSLMLTGTDLEGVPLPVGEGDETYREHRALFRFSEPVGPGGMGSLVATASRTPKQVAADLALAGRSSASFPGAFEASELPSPEWMHITGSGSVAGSAASSRYAMDGGILDNSPFTPMLREIEANPTGGDLDRTVVFVTPYDELPLTIPGTIGPGDSARPGLIDTLGWTSALKGEFAGLINLTRFSEQVARYGGSTRVEVMRDLLWSTPPEDLRSAAQTMLDAYRRARWRATADNWGRRGDREEPEPCRWLPPRLVGDTEWSWGTAPVRRLAAFAVRAIEDARQALPQDSPDIVELRSALLHGEREVRAVLSDVADSERGRSAALNEMVEAATPVWTALAKSWTTERRAARASQLDGVASALTAAAAALDRYASAEPPATDRSMGPSIDRARRLLGLPKDVPPEEIPTLLLALEVVIATSLEGSMAAEIRPDLRLVTLKGGSRGGSRQLQVRHILTANGAEPVPTDRKLLGMSLAHFGGFLYRSWRANDWMFGRLDAVATVARIALAAERVELVRSTLSDEALKGLCADIASALTAGLDLSDEVVAGSLREALGDTGTGGPEALVRALVLRAYQPPGRSQSEALRDLQSVAIWRMQVEVLREELPTVRRVLAGDRAKGARMALADPDAGAEADGPAPAGAALSGFASYDLPRSGGLKRQWVSAPMIALIARVLIVLRAALGRSVRLDSPKSKLVRWNLVAPLRFVLLALRSIASAPVWVAGGGRTAGLPAVLRSFSALLLAGYLVGDPSNTALFVLWCVLAALLAIPWAAVLAFSLVAGTSRIGERLLRAAVIAAAGGLGAFAGVLARQDATGAGAWIALPVLGAWLAGVIVARVLERRGIDPDDATAAGGSASTS